VEQPLPAADGGPVTIIPMVALFLLVQRDWRGGPLPGSIAN
jgi:hypothetical protein